MFDPLRLAQLVATLPVFLLAVTLHEVGHGYAAYLLGDDTARRAGRLTLNPLAHLDPLGTAMFILSSLVGFGFGWAKPVPIDLWRLRHPRRDRALLTLAGPGANLLQAVVWSGLLRLVAGHAGSLLQAFAVLCLHGVMINVVLLVFNLLPIPPLDGSHVAAWLLGVRDPGAVDRMAPVGFLALLLLVNTRLFDLLMGRLVQPVFAALMWGVPL